MTGSNNNIAIHQYLCCNILFMFSYFSQTTISSLLFLLKEKVTKSSRTNDIQHIRSFALIKLLHYFDFSSSNSYRQSEFYPNSRGACLMHHILHLQFHKIPSKFWTMKWVTQQTITWKAKTDKKPFISLLHFFGWSIKK